MTQDSDPSVEVTDQVLAVEEPGATIDQRAQGAEGGGDGSDDDGTVEEPAGEGGGSAAVEEPADAAKTNLD